MKMWNASRQKIKYIYLEETGSTNTSDLIVGDIYSLAISYHYKCQINMYNDMAESNQVFPYVNRYKTISGLEKQK